MSAQSKIAAARVSLVLEQPFFAALALGLTVTVDPGCGTAWTDGRSFGYDPAFIESLSHGQITALFAHEVMHCALGHPWRRDARDAKEWNHACDMAINPQLRDAGFTLPPDGLYASGDELGKSAEWIYERIRQTPKPDPQGNGQGAGNTPQSGQGPSKPDPLGEVRDAPTDPGPDGQPAPSEQDWKQRVSSAMVQAKMQGNMPAGIAREVERALQPRLDIRSLLLRFFSERSASDYSWTRPNSRYLAQGLYLPALESRELGEVAIMVDTSGSVNALSLSYARGIVESVIEECGPRAVSVWYADAKVCRVDRFDKGEPLTWEPAGGGGTDFCPALAAIDAEGAAACIVCITDLDGRFPDVPPSMPVLWLATEGGEAPFGETVPVDR